MKALATKGNLKNNNKTKCHICHVFGMTDSGKLWQQKNTWGPATHNAIAVAGYVIGANTIGGTGDNVIDQKFARFSAIFGEKIKSRFS
jgi:hypothetical protein